MSPSWIMVASDWRYQSWLEVALAMLSAATVCATSVDATAAEVPPEYCAIDRAPSLSSAERDDCSRDEDGNGLDDETERKLASCFAPAVALDSHENALGLGDPRVIFSARLIGPNLVAIRYVYLFTRDTGYVFGTEFPCLKYDHNGDLETVDVDITWVEHDRRFFGTPVAMHTVTIDQLAGHQETFADDRRPLTMVGTHPLIYATAGKHHWSYREARDFTYGCDCGPFGRCGTLRERADGKGTRVVPTAVGHAPGFHVDHATADQGDDALVIPEAPLADDGRRFVNACEWQTHGRAVPASGAILTNDLGDLGYVGERILGLCFRGGLGGSCEYTSPVANGLAWQEPFLSAGSSGKLVAWLLGEPGGFSTRGARTGPGFDRFVSRSQSATTIHFNAVAGLSRLVSRWVKGDERPSASK